MPMQQRCKKHFVQFIEDYAKNYFDLFQFKC